jgi:hypothetical protein
MQRLFSQNVSETTREHSGNIQGTFREHSGNIQGTIREHSGNIQRNPSEHQGTSMILPGNIRHNIQHKRVLLLFAFLGSVLCQMGNKVYKKLAEFLAQAIVGFHEKNKEGCVFSSEGNISK